MKAPEFHVRILGLDSWLWLLITAFCECRSCNSDVVMWVVGFPPFIRA